MYLNFRYPKILIMWYVVPFSTLTILLFLFRYPIRVTCARIKAGSRKAAIFGFHLEVFSCFYSFESTSFHAFRIQISSGCRLLILLHRLREIHFNLVH